MTIVNGEIDNHTYHNAFPGPPDRVIKLANFSLELKRTSDGGWKEKGTTHMDPRGGSGAGHTLAELARHHPWVSKQMWHRIIELEDELRVLRKAITYKEPKRHA
jgi:hypothetical protein